MLLVQLRKTLCPSTYVEIIKPDHLFLDVKYSDKVVYTGEARHMPVMYDEVRIDKIGTSVNRCGSPEILIKLEY